MSKHCIYMDITKGALPGENLLSFYSVKIDFATICILQKAVHIYLLLCPSSDLFLFVFDV
jgi:hypothetical protein